MILSMGLEDMSLAAGKSLSKKLIKYFQQIIDAREQYDGVAKRTITVMKMAQKLAPQIKEVIESETNLTISSFKFDTDLGGALTHIPFTNIDVDRDWFAYIIEACRNGMDHWEKLFDHEQISEIEDIAKTFDKHKGKLGAVDFFGSPISCTLMLDLDTYFLSREKISEEAPQLTAEEIAALLLKEIGHFLTTIQHMTDTILKVHVVKNMSIKTIKDTSVSVDKKMKLMSDALKSADNTKENVSRIKLVDDGLKQLYRLLDSDSDTKTKDSVITRYLVVPLLTLFSIIMLPLFSISQFIIFAIGNTLSRAYVHILTTGRFNVKTGDMLWSYKEVAPSEQGALDYVANLHLGTEYGSAIIKQQTLLDVSDFKSKAGSVDRGAFIYNMSKSFMLLNATTKGLTGEMGEDTSIAKMKSVMRSLIAIFKQNPGLSNQVMAEYIADYDRTCKLLDNLPKLTKWSNSVAKATKVITKVLSSPKGLFSHDINHSMKLLSDTADELTDNKLYANAAKLDQLSSLMK